MTRAEETIRVVVADDSYVIREGLAATLADEQGIELVGVCSDGNELVATIAAERPAVAVADIRMPPSGDGEGIRIAVRLRETHPDLGVVMLSQYVEPAYAISLMGSGTSRRAYLLKDRLRDKAELLRAIRSVAAGGSVVDPAVVDALIRARTREERSPLAQLTTRESEILAGIAEGKSNAAIADSLVLTKRAVEKHVNSIFAKLDLPGPQDVSRRVAAALLFLAEDEGVDAREQPR
jgi:DNA-binding NarL/FixJ family response regulator